MRYDVQSRNIITCIKSKWHKKLALSPKLNHQRHMFVQVHLCVSGRGIIILLLHPVHCFAVPQDYTAPGQFKHTQHARLIIASVPGLDKIEKLANFDQVISVLRPPESRKSDFPIKTWSPGIQELNIRKHNLSQSNKSGMFQQVYWIQHDEDKSQKCYGSALRYNSIILGNRSMSTGWIVNTIQGNLKGLST